MRTGLGVPHVATASSGCGGAAPALAEGLVNPVDIANRGAVAFERDKANRIRVPLG